MEQNFLLELDGKATGRFFDFSGGTAAADVVTVPRGGTYSPKHISNVRYEDMSTALAQSTVCM
jgi:hypothetical protein